MKQRPATGNEADRIAAGMAVYAGERVSGHGSLETSEASEVEILCSTRDDIGNKPEEPGVAAFPALVGSARPAESIKLTVRLRSTSVRALPGPTIPAPPTATIETASAQAAALTEGRVSMAFWMIAAMVSRSSSTSVMRGRRTNSEP